MFDLATSLTIEPVLGGGRPNSSTTNYDNNKQSADELLPGQNDGGKPLRGLVFVESEQLLVVGTDFGWQPVQLLPALRDFRKTIAKFSLTSSDQRRKLMSASNVAGLVADDSNSIKPIIMHRPGSSRSAVSMRQTPPAGGNGNLYSGYEELNAAADVKTNDEDEEEEEDDDDDDDDIDDGDTVVDGNQDDDDDGESDEPENSLRSAGGRAESSNLVQGAARNLRAQPSARSAAAALVSASIDNSVTMGSPVRLIEPASRQQPRDLGERRMRVSNFSQVK